MKHPVDIDNWNRRENYLFFRDFANPYYSVTSQVDVTEAYYGHEIEMYTVEQGEKRDKRQ